MNNTPTNPVLTHAVKYTWEELERAAAELIAKRAAEETKAIEENFDPEAIVNELTPIVTARVREEIELVLEMTMKNARTRIRKEIEARIDEQVREAIAKKLSTMASDKLP